MIARGVEATHCGGRLLQPPLECREGTVKLDILRKGKKETVSVKWP